MIHEILTILSGILVGFALGLTGGGGSIFAVPLLIYLLGVEVRTAVGVSLAVVGATSAFGVAIQLPKREIDYRIGLIFALSGMLATPLGIEIGARLPPSALLVSFAVLMLVVGFQMWREQATPAIAESPDPSAKSESGRQKSVGGFLRLIGIGIIVGLFTGIFGVGGGFIIVPALVLFGGVAIHRAVATSLLVITLVCVAGVASYLFRGEPLPLTLTVIFVGGGALGMFGGGILRSKLSGAAMRRTFALAMGAVAIFVIAKTILGEAS